MAESSQPAILTREQSEFLEFFAHEQYFRENYYFTGGTVLTVFYLQHRYSEDLDFFTEKQEVDILAVQQLIAKAKQKFNLTNVSYKQYYGLHTFFLTYPNKEELKVDFNYYPFRQIGKPVEQMGLLVDSLKDIAVNKIQSIATRTNARDFVDIYFIWQQENFDIRELWQLARMKFDWYTDPIQLGKQLLKVRELKDYPRMIKQFDNDKFITFFEDQAREIGKEVVGK